ncbi:MAG TPA: helicase-related protein [Thermoanaerobaculia bacterium]|nr:helicase-related protein [Thermoanaerobaculia bacterium]
MNDRSITCRELFVDLLAPDHDVSEPLLEAYQASAAARLIEMVGDRRGAVLADDVGIGKSWIAAAVGRYFADRGHAIDLVVPATLIDQWRHVLGMFAVEATLVSHDSIRGTAREYGAGKRLLIVDEAHRFRNRATRRYRKLALASVGHEILLVTATPICNRLDDLLAILQLAFADDVLRDHGVASLESAFAAGMSEQVVRVAQHLVVRRDLRLLEGAFAMPALSKKVVRFEIDDQTIGKVIDSMTFPIIATSTADRRLLRTTLWRRLESSRAALIDSLRRQRRFYRRARESYATGARLSKADFRRLFGDAADEAPYQELLFRELWTAPATASPEIFEAIDEEMKRIDDGLRRAALLEDRKLDRLVETIDGLGARRALLFTSAIATAEMIFERMASRCRAGLVTSRRCTIGKAVVRDPSVVFSMLGAGRLDLVVCTDLAAEGLNLQAAEVVVQYDLPWNPVRLEQRTGRARRRGQLCGEVESIYFVPARRGDRAEVIAHIARKNRVRRALFGCSRGIVPEALLPGKWLTVRRAGHTPGRPSIWKAGGDASLLVVGRTDAARFVLAAGLGSEISDSWVEIDRILEQRGCDPMEQLEQGGSLIAEVTGRFERVLLSRWLIPPALSREMPQLAYLRALERLRLDRRPMLDLLSRRYRAGVELMIAEAARLPVDARSRDRLERLLSAEPHLAAPAFELLGAFVWS